MYLGMGIKVFVPALGKIVTLCWSCAKISQVSFYVSVLQRIVQKSSAITKK